MSLPGTSTRLIFVPDSCVKNYLFEFVFIISSIYLVKEYLVAVGFADLKAIILAIKPFFVEI